MAAGGTGNRTKIDRSPEERERLEAIRERYQRERPTPEQLASSGDFEAPVLQGPYLELRAFCAALKRERLASGLTLADVAERTGIDVGSLSRLETGRNPNPTFDTLSRFAAALGNQMTLGLEGHPVESSDD